MIRYRTRDICVLDRSPCPCGRTHVRMSKPMGRSDDMMIIRGVNVFPSQIEAVLLRVGGQNAVSIYGILMYVDGLIQPLMYGACDSLQPAVSYNWGAGNRRRILAIEKYCFSAAAGISLLSAVVLFLFPGAVTTLFLSDMDAAFLATAQTAIRLFALTYLTRWFSFASQSLMTALERAGEASLISTATALIFPVILLAVLSPLGLTGVWLNFAGSSLLAGILSLLLLLRFWKKHWNSASA